MPIRPVLQQIIAKCLLELGVAVVPEQVGLERPLRPEHGDWSTNAALVHAGRAGLAPRELAGRLAELLSVARVPHLESLEVAGPGFVNIHLQTNWLHDVLRDVVAQGEVSYAASDAGGGERVQIEFVSANPTGPLHVGNGWWGAYGDSLARVMQRCGYTVLREYYVNDTGGQITLLGESLLARRRGEEPPEGGYQGDYLAGLADEYAGPDEAAAAGRWASERILSGIVETLASISISFDEWYSQASVEESGAVEETVGILRAKGLVEEREGALWFRSSELGDSRDRVLVRSGGEPTYLGGDLAYHRDKFLVRGFDRVVDIFGADHHGQVASLKAGVEALGIEPERLEVLLGQMVSLVEGGKTGRMSKRAGNFVPLDDLVADIGPDAVRLLALNASLDQATNLDLDLVREQSMENPVYYVQYAHARIASMERVRREREIARIEITGCDLGVLKDARELDLLRRLEEFPDIVAEACAERAPHKVTAWVRRLAGAFHGFYHDCPVLALSGAGDPTSLALMQARLWLVEGARIGFAIALSLIGISAPEKM